MVDLSLIASRLEVRAIDLDRKSSKELLDVLLGEIRSLDSQFDTSTPENLFQFLHTHKYLALPVLESDDEWDDWISSKENILSMLDWILSNWETLVKRCHLAKFLMPVNIQRHECISTSSNDNLSLAELNRGYKELQQEFVHVHQAYEKLSQESVLTISEMSQRCRQLDEERETISLRCKSMDANDDAKFQQLFQLTRKLRKEQAREITLEQQKDEQLKHTDKAEKRLDFVSKLNDALSNNQCSFTQCIARLEEVFQEAMQTLEVQIIPNRMKIEAAKNATTIAHTNDIEYLEEMYIQLKTKLEGLTAATCSTETDLSKQVEDLSSRLLALKKDANMKSALKTIYTNENQKLRDDLETNNAENNFLSLESKLCEKVKLYELETKEILLLKLSELEMKKNELSERLESIEKALREREERNEVKGYRYVHNQLSKTFEDTCRLNELKSETLEEVGDIVKGISVTLEEKKHILEPMITKLKKDRALFKNVREEHKHSQTRYEEVQHKLAGENKSLVDRFERIQQECVERETTFKLLMSKEIISSSTLEQILEEEVPQRKEKTEPSFPFSSNLTYSQLYENKISQLHQLRDELMRIGVENEGEEAYNLEQEEMFSNLKKLLEMKQRSLIETIVH